MRIIKGKFLERVNRFTCEVSIGKKREKAYLANSGRLKEILEEGRDVILSRKEGKLPYKLLGVRKNNVWISTDAHLVNRFFEEAVNKNEIKFLRGWKIKFKEIKIGNSRIDFVLERNKKTALCEIKSCTLVINGIATFPDAPTKRGVRHINTLIKKKRKGYKSFIVFIAQREDAKDFAPNSLTHPEFSKALYRAISEGVRVYFIIAEFDAKKISLKLKSWKRMEILDMLKNEYHLWRYPEVLITKLKRRKNYVYTEMKGTTCLHCAFEENLFDFVEFAKDRGIEFKIEKVESFPGMVRAKISWGYK